MLAWLPIISGLRCILEVTNGRTWKQSPGTSGRDRELTKSHAQRMVEIRELKRAAIKAGKPWPPRDRKLPKLS